MYIHKPCGTALIESPQEEYEDDNPFCTSYYKCTGCRILMARCLLSDIFSWWMFWATKLDEWKVFDEAEIEEVLC